MATPDRTTTAPSGHKVSASVFLSYNSADRAFVRRFAAALAMAGANVWFDEWNIRPGDSIPGAMDQGLAGFDTFVLVWSKGASGSRWVRTEMEAAITRWNTESAIRLIPVLLDRSPLPVLLGSLRHIDGTDGDHLRVTRELLGIESKTEFRLAVQAFIDEAGLEFREFRGIGVLVVCPRCGTTPGNLEPWEAVDDQHDNLYVGVRCKLCGWSDGGEM